MNLSFLLYPLFIFLIVCFLTVPLAITSKTLFKKSNLHSWVLGFFLAIGTLLLLISSIRHFGLNLNLLFPVVLFRYHLPEIIIFGGGVALAAVFVKLNKPTTKKPLLYSAAGMLGVAYIFISLLLFMVFNPGSSVMMSNFHYFNDHIKSLCVYREDKIECPRTEANLASFNHRRWKEFTSAAEVEYSFDPATEKYTFSAQDHQLKIYSTQDEPGYFSVTFP